MRDAEGGDQGRGEAGGAVVSVDVDDAAAEILGYILGRDKTEIGFAIDETDVDYNPDIASDYAWLTSRLINFRDDTLGLSTAKMGTCCG